MLDMLNKIFLFICLFVLFFSYVASEEVILSRPSMCCEKTVDGLWCINEPEEKCDSSFRMAPTSCERSSYCRLGTCYDSGEGICYENTPQRVCEDNGGTWDNRKLGEVPQCQLGCCLVADQASFVPLVRCKKLSTYFGVSVDYRADIETEMSCIVLANSQDMGACVYEKDFERICEFTTRGNCGADESIESITAEDQLSPSRKFFKDYLCSAEELNDICAKQVITGCYQGKVHWYDGCGNRENVYSSNKAVSWNRGKVLDPDSVCSPTDGTDSSCGNCDYMLGSRCEAKYGLLAGEGAFCQRTDCTDRWGQNRLNGESWCVNDGMSGGGRDKIGSRYYREVCVDGEVRVEPCADFRNEVCYESSVETSKGEFSAGACRINRWQGCVAITEENSCLNADKRDCLWLDSPVGLLIGGAAATAGGASELSNPTAGAGAESSSTFTNPTSPDTGGFTGAAIAPITGESIFGKAEKAPNETTTSNRPEGVCVPRYPAGLQFWEGGSASSICGMVGGRCVVEYKRGAFGDWECTNNCDCLNDDWAVQMNRICTAQGDCGAYVNYIGKFTDSGYEWLTSTEIKAFKAGAERYIKSGFTGGVISDLNMQFENSINKQILKPLGF
jgi:hypothetical protein